MTLSCTVQHVFECWPSNKCNFNFCRCFPFVSLSSPAPKDIKRDANCTCLSFRVHTLPHYKYFTSVIWYIYTCTIYIYLYKENCILWVTFCVFLLLRLLLLLQFFQNNKLRANNAGSHGNKLKNKQKSKCMATILNNKWADPIGPEKAAAASAPAAAATSPAQSLARCKKKASSRGFCGEMHCECTTRKNCSQRLPAAASVTKQQEQVAYTLATCHGHGLAYSRPPLTNCSCIVHRIYGVYASSTAPSKSNKIKCREIKFHSTAKAKKNANKKEDKANFFSTWRRADTTRITAKLQLLRVSVCVWVWDVVEAYFKKLKMQNFICATCATLARTPTRTGTGTGITPSPLAPAQSKCIGAGNVCSVYLLADAAVFVVILDERPAHRQSNSSEMKCPVPALPAMHLQAPTQPVAGVGCLVWGIRIGHS